MRPLFVTPMLPDARKDGGPDRDRTGDLMNAIHARSQLRYWPTRDETPIVARAALAGKAGRRFTLVERPDTLRRLQQLHRVALTYAPVAFDARVQRQTAVESLNDAAQHLRILR